MALSGSVNLQYGGQALIRHEVHNRNRHQRKRQIKQDEVYTDDGTVSDLDEMGVCAVLLHDIFIFGVLSYSDRTVY